MNRFHVIDDAAVILRTKGVYRQAKVYSHKEGSQAALYAGYAGGFIGLRSNGGTTKPDVSWTEIEAGPTTEGQFGKLVLR